MAPRRTRYDEMVRAGITRRKALDEVGLVRTCCRARMLAHVPMEDDLARFPASDVSLDEVATTLSRTVRHSRVVSCDTRHSCVVSDDHAIQDVDKG